MFEHQALLQICSAISASHFSTRNKIKAILQTAYEYLQADSIIAYEYNRRTNQLEIVTMPGVKQREFMRGPTDRLIFQWDAPPNGHEDLGIWLETRETFDGYLNDLQAKYQERSPSRPLPQRGTFRTRENPNAATAKICLWKGLDQTDDCVGQIFFNFTKPDPEEEVFTPSLKQIVRDICVLIRELLIDEIYHENLSASRAKEAAPERLLRDVSQLFAAQREGYPESLESLEYLEGEVASGICDMVRTVTENISGHVDLVLFDERSLAKVFEIDSKGRRPNLQIVQSDSLTGQCVAERKYVLINDTEKASQGVTQALRKHREFDPSSCKSLLLVPIAYEGEVRAVIRLTNSRRGFFLDAHAKAMQEVELVVLQCLLRVEERRQRLRMASALDFYTASQFLPGSERFWSLLQRLPKALGATWGTYWPRIRIQDGEFQAPEGIKFTSTDVTAPDEECGIRTGVPARTGVVGLTELLYRLNLCPGESVFLCLHVLQNVDNPKYLLRFYSSAAFPYGGEHGVERVLADEFHLLEFTEGQTPPCCAKPVKLNPNTTKAIHTRIAFVVRERCAIKSIVWLNFDGIHTLDWWERSYIHGLSGIIGRLEGRSDFQLALKGFGHFQLFLCAGGFGQTHKLRQIAGCSGDLLSAAQGCERAFRFLRNQADDMRVIRGALQLSPDNADAEARFRAGMEERPIARFVDDAIELESRGQRGDIYEVHYDPEEIAKDSVKSVFCSVLFHLVDNAVNKGLHTLGEEDVKKIVIWVRGLDSCYETVVADSGKELESDPLKDMFGLEQNRKDDSEHGAGLRVCRILLGEFDGGIKWMSRDDFFSTYQNSLSAETISLTRCNTFFSFTIPR